MTAGIGDRHPQFFVPAEFALGTLSLATIYGFSRVFESLAFFGPLAFTTVYAHLIIAVTRRRGWPIAAAGFVGLGGLLLLLTYLYFPTTTSFGLPTGRTVEFARVAFERAYAMFREVQAPAPVEDGFVLAASFAFFFAAFLADWAAFRLWSSFEAIVPAATLFIFCSLLGAETHRVDSVVVFSTAALVFVLLHRIARRETSAGWLAADVKRGSRAQLGTGLVLAGAAVVSGVLVAPRLPGAEAGALLSWRPTDAPGGGDRFTVSPLVEIRSRLVDQATTELFTVRAAEPAYWRLTSLDTFDGNAWRSKGTFRPADGEIGEHRATVPSRELEQQYEVTALARLWLPAAFEPIYVSSDAHARYQADSATLIVDGEYETSDGFSYTVRSAIPAFSADQLRNASTDVPPEIAQRYLALPDGFSETAKREAEAHTAGATTNYDKLLMLQNWFRGPEFTYDLNGTQAGHSEAAIDAFLRTKRGYCEQFAGTFAAMARHLGIPARVAVGFTPGVADPDDPNVFHVQGLHAHAWPEVYLGEYGWVYFEPTKSRGAPGTEAWTGVRFEQADPSNAQQATTTSTTATQVPTVPTTAANAPTTNPADLGLDTRVTTPSQSAPWWRHAIVRVVMVLGIVALLAGGYIAAMLALRQRQRLRRRQRAVDPSSRVRVAWEESLDQLSVLGAAPEPAETHTEFAHRLASSYDDLGPPIIELAADTDAAAYAPEAVSDDIADRAEAAASSIALAVRDRTTAAQQWRHRLDPRPLVRSRRRRMASRHRATSAHR